MAYDASKETQVNIGMVKKNQRGDYIKIQRIIPKDESKLPSVDIRNMYTADDGEVYPARQGGVRMNSELLIEVMKLVYKAMSTEERIDFKDAISEIDEEDGGDYDMGSYEITEQGDN